MEAENGLIVRIDGARNLLAQARTIEEVKDVRDKAEAIRAYIKQRDGSLEAQNMAAELKIRAERKLGELLRDNPDFGRGKKSVTVTDLGIDHNQSKQWQREAALPADVFDQHISEVIESGRELTSRGILTFAKKYLASSAPPQANGQVDDACTVDDLQKLIDAGRTFGTVYADPPWQYDNQGTRAATDNHYRTMTVDEIAALPVKELAAPQAHLWLWTTNAFLFDCPRLFAAWGFEFKSSYVWCKPQIGIGNYLRNSHEFLLLAVKGELVGKAKDVRSWGEYDRTEHSAKPEPVRRTVVQAVSPGPYLELFGRSPVDGWIVWGNAIKRGLFDDDVKEL